MTVMNGRAHWLVLAALACVAASVNPLVSPLLGAEAKGSGSDPLWGG